MGKIASDETKEIPVERWEEWCDLFTNGNRGRLVGIEIVDDELGAQPLADDVELVAIDYDPAGKGNDFVLSYGDEGAPSRHIVAGPVALWQAQDRNGVVVSVEIQDVRGGRTIVTLA
jgi:myo-inositol-hexaphosphate 3-phosphohydrolase